MMNQRIRTAIFGGLTAAIVAFVGAVGDVRAETWKIQSLWQAGSVNQKVFERFANNVTEASGGRLAISHAKETASFGVPPSLYKLSAVTGIFASSHLTVGAPCRSVTIRYA